MDGYKELEQYDVDLKRVTDWESYWDLIKKLTNIVAEDRKWVDAEKNLCSANSSYSKAKVVEIPDNGYVFAGLFGKGESVLDKEGFLCHLDLQRAEGKVIVSLFVFPELEVQHSGGYYEHSSTGFYLKDDYFLYEKTETYADCADIHDHDHYDVSVRAMYDYKNHTFYFPE